METKTKIYSTNSFKIILSNKTKNALIYDLKVVIQLFLSVKLLMLELLVPELFTRRYGTQK